MQREGMEIKTRQADTFDAVAILQLLMAMHDESRLPLSPVDPGKALNAINHAISKGYVEVALQDGYIVGAIGGMTFQDWGSAEERFADLFFYIAPECRKSNAAKMLLRKFIDYVVHKHGFKLKVGTVTGEDLERKDKFFGRMGFVRAGCAYILEGK